MDSACKINPIDLKSSILKSFQEKDPEIYSKIINFKNLLRIDEILDGRYSMSFLLDLFFAFENNSINIDSVMHEVKFLEGKESESKTKAHSQFRHPPLKGLWHKHYFDTSIPGLVKNVQNALKNYSIPYFDQKIIEAKESGEEQYVTAEDIPCIVNDVVTGNLKRRREEQKITGEWFIYAVHENINYYLCLAKHQEEDELIRKKIDSSCIHEFPFLKEILPNAD